MFFNIAVGTHFLFILNRSGDNLQRVFKSQNRNIDVLIITLAKMTVAKEKTRLLKSSNAHLLHTCYTCWTPVASLGLILYARHAPV